MCSAFGLGPGLKPRTRHRRLARCPGQHRDTSDRRNDNAPVFPDSDVSLSGLQPRVAIDPGPPRLS